MVWKYLFVTHIVNNLKQKEQFWVWPASSQNQIKVQLKKGALKRGLKRLFSFSFYPLFQLLSVPYFYFICDEGCQTKQKDLLLYSTC